MEHSEHTSHTTCETGDTCVLERPRYFPRQLITPAELTLEQDYFREKHRLHNRFLHGWGVVCGARVCPVPTADGSGFEPWRVRVERGYLLDPFGNDILLDRARAFDLRTKCQTIVAGEPCTEPEEDPWCRDVFERPRTENAPLYVAVRYREFRRRPVRVQPAGCGCDDSQCEYSRWCDGYEICVLPKCPESHCQTASQGEGRKHLDAAPAAAMMDPGRSKGAEGERPLATRGVMVPCCPECPSDPWVVLAKVEIDAGGRIQTIDNCACRRLVVSFAHHWWTCETGVLVITEVSGGPLMPGDSKDLTVTGQGFTTGLEAHVGDGITVEPVTVQDPASMTMHVAVDPDAQPGPRTLTIRNPDCSTATKVEAVEIVRAGEPGQGDKKEERPKGADENRRERPARRKAARPGA